VISPELFALQRSKPTSISNKLKKHALCGNTTITFVSSSYTHRLQVRKAILFKP